MTVLSNARALGNEPYRTPPAGIVRVLEAAPTPMVSIDPTRSVMLLVDRVNLPPIADLARPMLRLAGERIDPSTNGPHGPRRFSGYTIKRLADGAETRVKLPADADVSMPSWSPDGTRFAFQVTKPDGIELWVGDATTGQARALTGPRLNAVGGAAARWMPDSQRLLCLLVPEKRGPAPQAPSAPAGPVVQESSGLAAQVRTYQDLLVDVHSEALYEYYSTSVPAVVDASTGKASVLGAPGLYSQVSPSPDGRFLLVTRTVRPFSYVVPAGLFPEVVEVWDAATGKVVRELARVPLREDIPIQGVQKGPRSHQWRDLPGPAGGDAGSTLVWAEALDEGDPRKKVPHRDRLLMLDAPFTGEAREVMKLEHRYRGMQWTDDRGFAFVSEFDRDRRWSRTWLANIDSPTDVAHRVIWDLSVNDRYNNPGSPVTRRLPSGRSVVRVTEGTILLSGQGATPEGDRPFLDRMNLADGSTKRLWRCEGENLESVVDTLRDDGSVFITMHQSPSDVPNYYVRDLGLGSRRALTEFTDPVPELRRIRKELVKYERDDGVELSATMYTPPDYDAKRDGPLPMLVWAYPLEYNDPATAGQVSGSPHTFTRLGGSSHLFLLLAGYAVMDGATMPVVGSPENMNDTFVEQASAAAKAAIDKAVEMGVADRHRVAVGGHSYGAFMTANLLAHTDLFRGGIARSGAYNRTLTPFGFQGERRTYWEATDTYTKLSPFTVANKVNEPILLIHGMLDSNPGTFPIQSERLYAAIKGHGGTARYVQLPFEDHGYAAKESVMHVLAEMVAWLDRHVKGASTGER
ncbi:MAG: S9 family peptidase [Phycisphaerae bacterium]|nr:S9 family peptidase [Phycisphaerae bacterium]